MMGVRDLSMSLRPGMDKRSDRLVGFQSALQSIPGGTWKILITDDHTQSLLDIVYRPGEILQQNVTCESDSTLVSVE